MGIQQFALRIFFAAIATSLFLTASNAAPENPSALISELGAQVKLILADTTLSPIETPAALSRPPGPGIRVEGERSSIVSSTINHPNGSPKL